MQPCLSTLEYMLPSYAARRIQDLAVSRPMIVELDESSDIHMVNFFIEPFVPVCFLTMTINVV